MAQSSIPQVQPPMSGPQIPVNYTIATGTVIFIDQCVAKPIVEKSELPDELKGIARGTLDITALYGVSKGAEALGLGGGWNWAKLFGAFPLIVATQSTIGYVMHKLGYDPSETRNEITRIALSLAPLYFAQHFPSIYSAMTASMSGEGLTGLSLTSPAGGAGFVGATFQSLIILGALILANQVAGGVTYVGGHITELNYEPDYPLMKRSYDLLLNDVYQKSGNSIYNWFRELFGGDENLNIDEIKSGKNQIDLSIEAMWLNGLLGNEVKIIQAFASYASEKFENNLVEGIDKFKNESIEATKDITKQLEDSVLDASLEAMKNENFDWDVFNRSIRDYYFKNEGAVQKFYDFVKLTGYAVPSAVDIKKTIDKNGYIISRDEFKNYLINLIERRYKNITDGLYKESISRGLVKIENGEMFTTEAKNYAQNKDYLEKKAKTLKYLTKLRALKLSLISND